MPAQRLVEEYNTTMLHASNVLDLAVGVDWLTATCNDTRDRDAFGWVGADLLVEEVKKGNERKSGRTLGYEAEIAGGATYGMRTADDLIQLRGTAARDYWKPVVQHASNVSRIDLAATFVLDAPRPDFGPFLYRAAKAHVPATGRPCKTTRTYDTEGGQTVYLGARVSDSFVRIYDKGVEEKTHEPGLRWRVEVEYKRKLAFRAAHRLLAAAEPAQFIAGVVKAEAEAKGAVVPYDASGSRICGAIQDSDEERSLTWLNASVSGCVGRLVNAGRLMDVLAALGLHEVAEIVERDLLRPRNAA